MSHVNPIPDGHEGRLVPHLTVGDASAAIAFYEEAFGATVERRNATPDGQRIMHAELRIDGAPFFLNDDFPEMMGGKSRVPTALGETPVTVHRSVADVDAVFQRAVEAGAEVEMPPMDMFWGDRYAMLRDAWGHRWSLSTRKSEPTIEEMDAAAKQAFGG